MRTSEAPLGEDTFVLVEATREVGAGDPLGVHDPTLGEVVPEWYFDPISHKTYEVNNTVGYTPRQW